MNVRTDMFVALGVALVAIALSEAQADFVLIGTDHLDVTTGHNNGVLFDASTADVLANGYIKDAYIHNKAGLTILRPSGQAISTAWAYDEGTISIHSGFVGSFRAYDSSSVSVSDGSVQGVNAYNFSSVAVSGGLVNSLHASDSSSVSLSGGNMPYLYLYELSSLDVSGGSIVHLRARGSCSVSMSGGSVSSLNAGDSSSVDISGGSISHLSARDSSNVTLNGYDFRAAAGLTLVEFDVINGVPQYEVVGTGVLTGRWSNNETFLIHVTDNASSATVLATGPTMPAEPYCGDANHPYPPMDFNKDCRVDLLDFAIFASHWLECTAPECQ